MLNERDVLTGLYTLQALDDVGIAFDGEASPRTWSVAMIDIDHLNLVNEVYGRITGDSVIQLLAGILRDHADDDLMTLRSGEDEFLVFFPGADKKQAMAFGHKVYEDLEIASFPQSMSVSVSMGFADTDEGVEDIHHLVTLARDALKMAKSGGRGRIHVHSASPQPDSLKPRFEHFVNRQFELEKLGRITKDVLSGTAQTVIISGEAGVGKTRLLQELIDYVSEEGLLVSGVSFAQDGSVISGMSLLDSIGSSDPGLSIEDRRQLVNLLDETEPLIGELAPWIGNFRKLECPITSARTDLQDAMTGIHQMMARVSEIRPVVIYFEDIQWASPDMLGVVGHLSRMSSESRLMLVLTIRTGEDDSGIRKFLDILGAMVGPVRVELDRLQEKFTTHMTTLALPLQSVPDGFLRTLHRKTGGNPLYIRELLTRLYEDGRLGKMLDRGANEDSSDSLGFREGLPGIIRERIEDVDRVSGSILGVAALVSKRFSFELIRRVLGLDSLEVALALDRLMEGDLLVEQPATSGSAIYGFSHELIRETVLQGMTQAERQVLDEGLGRYFEERSEAGDDGAILDAALHYCRTTVHDKASRLALLAARKSRSVAREKEEAEWLESYIEHSSGSFPDRATAFEVLSRLGRLLTFKRDVEKGLEYIDRAEEYALTDQQRGQLHFLRGNNLTFRGKGEEGRRQYLEALEFPLSDSDRDNVYLKLAYGAYNAGRLEEVDGFAGRFRQLAEQEEDGGLGHLSEALVLEGLILAAKGDHRGARDKFVEALGFLERQGTLKESGYVLMMNIACSYLEEGYFSRGMQYLQRAREGLEELGDTVGLGYIYSNLATGYLRVGMLDAARKYADMCIELGRASGHVHFTSSVYLVLAQIKYCQGDLPGAIGMLDSVRSVAEGSGDIREVSRATLLLGRYLASSGDMDGAKSVLSDYEASLNEDSSAVPDLLLLRALVLPDDDGTRSDRLDLLRAAWEEAKHMQATSCVHICSALLGELRKDGRHEEASALCEIFRDMIESEYDMIEDDEAGRSFRAREFFSEFTDPE